jgi:predicted porin
LLLFASQPNATLLEKFLMKKSLIAFAIFGAFAASASAQSSVTLYGIVDAGVAHKTSQTASGGTGSLESGQLLTSRWGIKGSEDLGDGMKAVFNLESTLFNDTGASGVGFGTAPGGSPLSQAGATTSLFDRLSYVGISSKLGTLLAGRNNMLGVDALAGSDPMNLAHAPTNPNIALASLNAAALYGNFGSNGGGSALRQNNSVKYSLPLNGLGLGGSLMYAFGEKPGDGSANSYKGVSGFFSDGKSVVGATFAKYQDNVGATGLGSTLTQKGMGAKIVIDPTITLKSTYLETTVDTTQRKIAVFGLGVDFNFTPATTFTAAYYDSKQSGPVKGISDQYIAMVKYAFSKRTQAYASFTHTNAGGATGKILALGLVGVSDHANRGVVGMLHAF